MVARRCFAALACTLAFAACVQAPALRLCILDCGTHTTTDLSPWTPGANVGQPWTFANRCYLIEHPRGRLLWDSGYPDSFAALADGVEIAGGAIRIRRPVTLQSQLASLGLRPADVTHVAFSHFHMDHAGNGNLFAASLLLVQRAELDAAFGPDAADLGYDPSCYETLRGSRREVLSGDHDVFGDGTVVILSTPGHTRGHQSLLVRLPHRGNVVLSGDVAHLAANLALRRVPVTNADRVQSVASMARIAEVVEREHAELWIPHERGQLPSQRECPVWID